ncbi:hypothetical protein Droror1_Dr00024110 [Drosera rotundifolia]
MGKLWNARWGGLLGFFSEICIVVNNGGILVVYGTLCRVLVPLCALERIGSLSLTNLERTVLSVVMKWRQETICSYCAPILNMDAYFNTLQGFLLLACGSMVGAGPTLSSSICASVKQVVDLSFMLWQESISFCGSCSRKQKLTIPQIVDIVWDTCSTLKKTSATNIFVIRRAIIQVAASMKYVLREM